MTNYDDFYYTQSVDRKIPGNVRVIQFMLYFAVLVFTIIGAMEGIIWAILALGTLFGSWYFMGVARVTYEYRLEGAHFTVLRESGLKSRRKLEPFGDFDLTKLIIMGPESHTALAQAEEDSANAQPKRITYDVSAHDPDRICAVMYLTGTGEEQDRALKVLFQPDPQLREYIRRIAPERVVGFE